MQNERLVDIIAFCIMPTHVHFALRQLTEGGISMYMGNVLNSYARYFNIKYRRKGPLYEGRFKSVLVESNEQLYHLTRYIHLNPVTAGLADKPEEWKASSYNEYTSRIEKSEKTCKFDDLLNIDPHSYNEFVMMRKDYQKELSRIKGLVID
jgi:putative transposase